MHLQDRAFARLIGATVLLVVATAAPARSQSNAAPSVVDRFIGTWQEDESKRQIGSVPEPDLQTQRQWWPGRDPRR